MFFPFVGFILALVLLLNLGLLLLGIPFYKKQSWLNRHRQEIPFLLAVLCLSLSLGLGLVGYLQLLDGGTVQVFRIDLGLISLGLFGWIFRQELAQKRQDWSQLPAIKIVWRWLCQQWQVQRTLYGVAFLFMLIAVALMAPMAASQVIFSINDHTSHIGYIVQARLALEEGQFPLRVAPLEDFGFRYPGFQFYSQFPYTLGALIYKFLTPLNPYDAYKILLWLALWLGGLFIYRLSLRLTRSPVASILAGVAYLSAPYFLNNIHARGAFTEAIAQGLLPIALFYAFQLFHQPGKSLFLGSSLAWFALAITHIITFVFGTLFIGLFGAIYILNDAHFKPTRLQYGAVAGAYLWAWLLGCYFLAPVVLESKILAIRRQIEVVNPFSTRWLTPLANLISPASLPPAPTELGLSPTYGLHPAVGWILLGAGLSVAYFLFSDQSLPSRLQPRRSAMVALLWVFVLAFLMTWSPVDIWNIVPKQLWVTQFTFRFLTHVMWSGALLTGFAIIFIFRERLDRRHLIVGILLIVMVSRPWLPVPRGTVTVEELLKEPLFRYSGALDYLYTAPITELYNRAELPTLKPNWIPGYGSWDIFINHPLVLDIQEDANIPYPAWPNGSAPILKLKATVPPETLQGQAHLIVQVNQKTVARWPLNTPVLNQSLALQPEWIDPEKRQFELRFDFDGHTLDGRPPYLRLQSFHFEGLGTESAIVPVFETQRGCRQQGPVTQCEVTLDARAGIVQLPVLYYPKMQEVWVDGQLAPALPVYHRNFSLVGLRLPPGPHQIRIQFVGLVWANWVSCLAWLAWLGLAAGSLPLWRRWAK
ncbi:hypothetical protein [Synechocystis sp. LKSZ1]|uniref:hypothetical protein n=1 Tax=Synechocystis sp. LKSZ1 TaxID=3144951 RepID=UPI00336C2017